MIDNATVWSLDVLVSYKDGTSQSGAIMQDFGAPRYINITQESDFFAFLDIAKEPAFLQFLTALGYTPSGGTPPTDINDYQFRFMAITTSGGIHVAGSNKELAGSQIPQAANLTIQSDDLPVITSILLADPNFNSIFSALAA